MKTPLNLLNDLKQKTESEDPEKMDFLMKTLKALRSSHMSNVSVNPEELAKQRADSERMSRIVTPSSVIDVESFMVGEVPCEWVRPRFAHRTDHVIMYCHGGGYTNGGLGYARVLAAKLAQRTSFSVITFEYRLAPENPFPAAIDDGEAVWNYIMNVGVGAKNVILAGDSAGGNLCLELCLRLKQQDRILPKVMVLMSPWTDMRLDNSSYKTYADKDPMLTYEYVEAVRNAYGGEDADFSDPKFSPLLADLSNMPTTLIQVGSNEILRDDSERLAKKYAKYGSLSKLEVYSGCWHVFQQMPIPKAGVALDSIAEFLSKYM